MSDLITNLGHNSLIRHCWLEMRSLTRDDFTLVETRAATWEQVCWKGPSDLSENWPRTATVTLVLELKPGLAAELEGLKEICESYDRACEQFYRWDHFKTCWRIYPGPIMQLEYRGIRKEDTARAKYEEAMAAAHERVDAVVEKQLNRLNAGFQEILKAERLHYKEAAVRLYTNPESWNGVRKDGAIGAMEAKIQQSKLELSTMRDKLLKLKGEFAQRRFEEYAESDEEGATSIPDVVKTAIRERFANLSKPQHIKMSLRS